MLNNKGYHSIRQTQARYFPENIIGCGTDSGLPFPEFNLLCQGFGIEYIKLEKNEDTSSMLDKLLMTSGPVLLEVLIDLDQEFTPKVSSKKLEDGSMISAELDDMSPFLKEEEKLNLKITAQSITR